MKPIETFYAKYSDWIEIGAITKEDDARLARKDYREQMLRDAITGMKQATTYQDQVKEAQKQLDEHMEMFYRNPANADGGSWDDRYRVLINIATRFEVEEDDLIN